jgi:hypothetical protein
VYCWLHFGAAIWRCFITTRILMVHYGRGCNCRTHINFCLRAGRQVCIIVALARGDGSHSEACHLNKLLPIMVHREIAATLKSPHLIPRRHIIRWKPPQKGPEGGRLHVLWRSTARGLGVRRLSRDVWEVRAVGEMRTGLHYDEKSQHLSTCR